ncbi:Phosphotyrosyl phosphatase activator [Tilletiaria anomala UBC 951]|uniref:Serine/threonine-protein phosphatase 2A activator n=1 Tax=Tilletiaria anomala (strain ATCC 24038 / CBS 436.72 / UBC 951) TaxID=1037660 RepID=A0A066WF90_TILAU|nr:Phosphotyrosyl phosphatase activator [Tilletiaria anomala UBC 951]KDN52431.1 Phosphotyrosyl phosphatase activator [Tilletiaria anomala UBC 951]
MVDPSRVIFSRPRKRIVSPRSLKRFEGSEVFDELLSFISLLNDAVIGKKLHDQNVVQSEPIRALLKLLAQVSALLDETPADKSSGSRFGNSAFRTFYNKVKDVMGPLHALIPGLPLAAVEEISVYLEESWGNEKRIDYGSGMELNFACWLLCLVKLGVLTVERDAQALVMSVFWQYITVMRKIQSTYWLEPAGSHGVWGLDDYHFLPFLWGSGQLQNHKHLKPKSIHDPEILDEFAEDYMYFACIKFINSIKTASLRWHSPMLDDISGVKTWAKVNEGMQKMYRAEVLLKLPIAQHIFFGSLLAFPEAIAGEEAEEGEAEEDEHGHIHSKHGHGEGQAAGWGDCCGIPIPSAFAAAAAEKEKSGSNAASAYAQGAKPSQPAVRRIPFD